MKRAKTANLSQTEYKRPESVLVVIYDEYGRFLLMNRHDNPEFWQSVTGSLEWNELVISAAYREVLEETGIDINALGLKLIDENTTNQYQIFAESSYKYHPDTKLNTEYVLSVKVPACIKVQLTEHFDYIWLPKNEAIKKASSETNKQAIDAINLNKA